LHVADINDTPLGDELSLKVVFRTVSVPLALRTPPPWPAEFALRMLYSTRFEVRRSWRTLPASEADAGCVGHGSRGVRTTAADGDAAVLLSLMPKELMAPRTGPTTKFV